MVDFGGAGMIEVGTVLEEHIFYLDRAMLKAYADASGDQNPIHQNEEFAVSVGLPNVISHGMLTMALVGKYVTCLLYTSPSPRDRTRSRMPSSA